MAWPITRGDVEAHLGVSPASPVDSAHLDRVTAAAVAWVERYVPVDDPELGYGVEVELGAVMLASRWYQRRSSIQGVAAFGEFGAAYVQRHDPDIASLLRLDQPRVG